ncbi:MFS transporter [Staphylococcus pseudintermedius]|uniref:MFS transporter n=1 Tax=Staphylococcus pseudintermedius TaxID=283734 RepID=UPI003F98456D
MNKSIILITFETISIFFSSIFIFACGFYVLKITHSGSTFGTYLAILAVITTVSSPFLGNLIDRNSNKLILIIGQLLSISILFVFFLIYNDEVYAIFLVMAVLVFVDSIVKTAISSNLKFITGDYLEKVVSIRQTIQSSSVLITPLLGGLIVTLIDLKYLALINAFTEFVAFLLLLLLKFKSGNITSRSQKFTHSFLDGIKHLISINNLKIIFIINLFINFLCNSLIVGLPIIIINHLNMNAKYLGLAEGTLGGAIVASSLLISILNIQNRLKFLYLFSMLLQAISLFIVSLTYFDTITKFYIFIIILISNLLLGFSVALNNIPFQVMLQKIVDENYKSRVFSIIQSMSSSITPVSYVLFGFLIPLNYFLIYFFCSIGMLILLVIFKIKFKDAYEHI